MGARPDLDTLFKILDLSRWMRLPVLTVALAVMTAQTASAGEVTTIDDLDCMAEREQQETCCGPCPVLRVPPAYPDVKKDMEGWVNLYVTVDTQGKPKDIVVINSSHKVFEQPSVDALKLWAFKPSFCQGRFIEQAVRIRMGFQSGE